MKILNLYFKNINSLRGESRIDFDQSPISDAGIFAITGPNGSGKSSILDAIMLALYGETYRFNKPAEHVMSKQTGDSFAQIEFKLSDKKYRCRWQVSRENNAPEGDVQTPTMSLSLPDEENQIIADTPDGVRQYIAEITGMDFHKFSQSMVLSQGQFSAFLNALDNERMSVLEKITGETIYQRYRQQTEHTHEQLKQDVEALQQSLQETPLTPAETVEANQHDLADFQEQVAEFTQATSDLEQQLQQAQQLKSLQNTLAEQDSRQQSLQQQQQQTTATLQEIEQAQPALLLKDDIADLERHRNLITGRENALSQLTREAEQLQRQVQAQSDDSAPQRSVAEQRDIINDLQQQIADHQAELPQENALLQSTQQQLTEKQASLQYSQDWLAEHDLDKSLVDKFPDVEKLKRLRKSVLELSDKQKHHGQWSKTTTQSINKTQSSIKSIAKNIKELNAQLAKDEQSIFDWTQGKSFAELSELQREQQERVDNFQELYDLADVNAKVGKKGFFARFKRNTFDMAKEEHELVSEQSTLQLEIAREENIRRTLEQAVVQEGLVRKLVKDREKLIDGLPCPLCGASKHPYVHSSPPTIDSRKALADQRGKLQALRSHADSLSIQIREIRQQEEDESNKDNKLKHIRSQWVVLSNRLNVADERLELDNLPLMKKLLTHEKKQLEEVNALLKKCSRLQQNIEKTRTNIQQQDALQVSQQNELETLNQEWNNRPRELVELEKNLAQNISDEKQLSKDVAEQLTQYGEALPVAGQEDDVFERLNHRRREYQTYQTRITLLEEEIVSLQDKVSLCQEDVDELNQKIQQVSESLLQEEQAGLHLALVEKQQLISQKEQQQQQEQQLLQQAKQQLEDKLKSSPFNSIEEAKQKLTLIARQPALQQEQQSLDQQLTTLETEISATQEKLTSTQQQVTRTRPIEELQAELKSGREKLSIASMEMSSLQKKLDTQSVNNKKAEALQQSLNQKQAQLTQCAQDIKLINDENASAFRRKVQLEMIDKLMSQTNSILEKISGRFYVRHEDHQQGFSLCIEDSLQNNQRRLPKTLSGGESFVVSLALALALSETTGNGHAVDSLFIDEGFGNLDAESLYLVMNTLEGLKTQGKTVGIISHIEAVQKRIKTQIEMIKQPDGYSALKLAVS